MPWDTRIIEPARAAESAELRRASPGLVRFLGMVGFTLCGLGTASIAAAMLGRPGLFSPGQEWDLPVFAVALLGGWQGMRLGWRIALRLPVDQPAVDHAASTLWQYGANGSLVAFVAWSVVLSGMHGPEAAKQWVRQRGEWEVTLLTLGLTTLASLLTGALLLGLGLLRRGRKPRLLPCMLVAVPVSAGVAYGQFVLLDLRPGAWLLRLVVVLPLLLIADSAWMVDRDRAARWPGTSPQPAAAPPRAQAGRLEFRPSAASLASSVGWALSPALLAGTVTWVWWERMGWGGIAAGVVMGLLSLFTLVQALFVHRRRIYLDGARIGTAGPLDGDEVAWSQVNSAVLRERVNSVSRDDRLLLMEAPGHRISFVTSTLSREDEETLLGIVRGRTRLVVFRDRPSI